MLHRNFIASHMCHHVRDRFSTAGTDRRSHICLQAQAYSAVIKIGLMLGEILVDWHRPLSQRQRQRGPTVQHGQPRLALVLFRFSVSLLHWPRADSTKLEKSRVQQPATVTAQTSL